MSDLNAFESLLEDVNALDKSVVQPLYMPVDVFIHEALRLYEWAGEDRGALEAAGMDWAVAETLPLRSAALRHAQSLWVSERFQNDEARRAWAERSPEAYDLRDTLLHTFRFAFRKRPDLMRVVDMIAAGSGHADMLQDLKDLSVAGRRNLELLEAVSADMTLFGRAETMAGELSLIYAEARNDRATFREAKQVRDAIATLLKQSVDEVREHGQYVFWRDARRRKGYASDYYRKANRPGSSSSEATEETRAEAVTE